MNGNEATKVLEQWRKEKMDFNGNFEDSNVELDENYCDEGGHFRPDLAPDGKDLYDAYLERTMKPSLDEIMSSPEFRFAVLEVNHSYLNMHLNKIDEQIEDIQDSISDMAQEISTLTRILVKHLFPDGVKQPDDFDTQKQVEDDFDALMAEGYQKQREEEAEYMLAQAADQSWYSEMNDIPCDDDACEEELPPIFFSDQEKQPVPMVILTESGKEITLNFPDLPTALKFTEGIQ